MLRSTLLVLVASALSAAAERGLSLKVSGAEAVDGVKNLHLTTTLVNTGDEALKLLNDPRSVLRQTPTHTFNVVHEDSGSFPTFNGVKVKYVPEVAVRIAGKNTFTVLAPGESVTLTHDLSSAYNFTASGEGRYSFEPSTLFHHVDESGVLSDVRATLDDSHSASLRGTLAVARQTSTFTSKRATYSSCSAARQTSLAAAAKSGNAYAAAASSYLAGHTASTTRFTTWFGTYTAARHTTVLSHYTKISSHDFSAYTFDCSCTEADTYAFVYADTFGTVHLCGAFWQAPTTGTDSKAGTLVHESSHFTVNGGTQDIVYGQSGAKSLAKSNPAQAVMNADSHEYFAENNPSQS